MLPIIIRLISTGVLIYFVYTETGIFTASCLILNAIAIELTNVRINILRRGVK